MIEMNIIEINFLEQTTTVLMYKMKSISEIKLFVNMKITFFSRTNWTKVDTLKPNITSYTVQRLVEGADYYFRVSAENKVGLSDPCQTPNMVTIKSKFCESNIGIMHSHK